MEIKLHTVDYSNGEYLIMIDYVIEPGDPTHIVSLATTRAQQAAWGMIEGKVYQCFETVNFETREVMDAGVSGLTRGIQANNGKTIDNGWLGTFDDLATYATGYRKLISAMLSYQEPLGSRRVTLRFGERL